MEFEQCEIRAKRYDVFPLSCEFEFVAEAVGPNGGYVVARTERFSPYEPSLMHLFFMPRHNFYEPDDKRYQRAFFDELVDYLTRDGWESLLESGVYWFSRRFRRRVSLYVPDPEPTTPYTLGDLEEWQGKALRALDQYERHRDARSCSKLAEAFLQLGLSLEREHQFEDACKAYFQAGQKFEEISATAEAAKAYLRAEQVLHRK